MNCEGCGQFFEPGQNSDMTQGGCPNCGRPLRYEVPGSAQLDVRMNENMPAPGEADMGGNPLKEGILADGGWKNRAVRDESFASVRQSWNDEMKNRFEQGHLPGGDGIHELCPHCRGEGCEACMGEGTMPIPMELTHDPQGPLMDQIMQQPPRQGKTANGLSQCRHCGATIDLALGAVPPTGEQHAGTPDDPRAPGDHNDICDQCNYGEGLRGGPGFPGEAYDQHQGSWDRSKIPQTVHMPWYAAEEKPEVDFEVEEIATPDPKSVKDKELKKEIKEHEKTSGLFGDVWNGLKNTVENPVNAVKDVAQGDFGGALNNVTDMATNSTLSPVFWAKTAWQNPEETALIGAGAGLGAGAAAGGEAAAAGGEAAGAGAAEAGSARGAAGWLKGAMGKGKGAAGNYMKMKGVETTLGDQPGGGGGAAPAPQGSPDPRTFQQVSHTAADFESPSSHGEIPQGHEDSDPKQKSDGDEKDWQKDFSETDEGGATQSPHQMDATFSPEAQAAYEMLFPLIHTYHMSDDDGSKDPLLKALHEILDSEIPGFMDLAGKEDEGEHHPQDDYGNDNTRDAEKAQHTDNTDADEHAKESRTSFESPLVQETMRAGQNPMGMMPSPTQGIPQMSGPSPNASKCFNGHDVDPSSQSCPQCGAAVMRPPGSPGADSPTLEHPQPTTIADDLAQTQQRGGITSSDHQGPHTPEQMAAVSKLLQETGRGGEIPNMILQPWMYAEELSKVQNNPNVPNEGGSPPQPAQEEAPPEATMPVPGMQAQDPGMAMQGAINRYSADNIAEKCPKCKSHTTRLVSQDGDCHCHSCGHVWKMKANLLADDGASTDLSTTSAEHEHGNPIDVPAAEQKGQRDVAKEQDSSLTWKDTNGEPLHVGRTYELHSNNASFPDIVKIDEVKPNGVSITTVSEYGQQYSNEIYHEEAALNDYQFSPQDDGAQQQTRDPGIEENNDYAPAMDTDGQVTDFSSPHQTQYASNVKPHLAWLDDDGAISRTAGRHYSPNEQRDFIDEQGVARNADKLNLAGTHYEEASEDHFLWL